MSRSIAIHNPFVHDVEHVSITLPRKGRYHDQQSGQAASEGLGERKRCAQITILEELGPAQAAAKSEKVNAMIGNSGLYQLPTPANPLDVNLDFH